MPLKHFTETFLVVLLGAVLALTGLLTSTLPALPDGALPWATLFVLSVIYPLSLHSLFQKRRADNFFRNLHWLPSLMLLLWLLLQGLALGSSVTPETMQFYTWGFSLLPVLMGFVALVLFILKVIRRRIPRLTFLALIIVPFTALGIASAQGGHYEHELAALLWQGNFWKVDDTGILAGLLDRNGSGKNLEPSEDPQEEEWRERIRQQEEREQRIAEQKSSSEKSSHIRSSSSSADSMMIGSVSSKPSKLPSSGFNWSIIISLFIVVYAAALHDRTRKRV
ncbi:hypothetical protein H6770_03935 [Candidatus Peribacteria bacterium]|nr:hypothetical protein [Candidatus Peribacteria bacterium]